MVALRANSKSSGISPWNCFWIWGTLASPLLSFLSIMSSRPSSCPCSSTHTLGWSLDYNPPILSIIGLQWRIQSIPLFLPWPYLSEGAAFSLLLNSLVAHHNTCCGPNNQRRLERPSPPHWAPNHTCHHSGKGVPVPQLATTTSFELRSRGGPISQGAAETWQSSGSSVVTPGERPSQQS